jgi:hypothetical protein
MAAAVALVGCGDYSAPSEVVNGVAVYTQPEAGVTFPPLATRSYYLDNDVTVRKDGTTSPIPDKLDSIAYKPVRDAIVAQMAAAGYGAAPVADASVAPGKVGLKLGIATASVNYYYSGGWCDLYYGWYGCYYPPVYAGSYSYGGAVLGMTDLSVPPAVGTQYPGLWFAGLYGVVPTYPSSSYSKLAGGITRAFEQSPYLSAP